jgi:hypothetical protein
MPTGVGEIGYRIPAGDQNPNLGTRESHQKTSPIPATARNLSGGITTAAHCIGMYEVRTRDASDISLVAKSWVCPVGAGAGAVEGRALQSISRVSGVSVTRTEQPPVDTRRDADIAIIPVSVQYAVGTIHTVQ